ncbi:hypothetical protein BDV12DRAFT_204644 [Aspergillus spectabilis]
MCALAAPFYSSSVTSTADTAARFFDAGKVWAERAAQSFYSNFGHLDIDSLMTEILLHEYYLRTGENPKAPLISGLIVEYDYDTYDDLYRVGVSGLVYPNTATKWIRQNAPEFITRCHRIYSTKAVHIANCLKELWELHKDNLVDVPYAVLTQVCSCPGHHFALLVRIGATTSYRVSPRLPQYAPY